MCRMIPHQWQFHLGYWILWKGENMFLRNSKTLDDFEVYKKFGKESKFPVNERILCVKRKYTLDCCRVLYQTHTADFMSREVSRAKLCWKHLDELGVPSYADLKMFLQHNLSKNKFATFEDVVPEKKALKKDVVILRRKEKIPHPAVFTTEYIIELPP